jgi:phosphotransferase system enzyme I (PtsI)
MILSLSGSGVSDGIAIGQVHLYSSGELELPELHIESTDVEAEVERLSDAAMRCERELARMEREFAGEHRSGPAGELIQAHRMMVRDDMLVGEAARLIRSERINAEWALDRQAASLRREFRRMQDEYLAMRVEDLDQVVRLLQRQLGRMPGSVLGDRVPHRLDETIVVADAFSPAELAALREREVAGLVTEHGSIWSHAAIVARALGIPMVMAVHRCLDLLREGEPALLDSHYGILLATRDEKLHAHYAEKQAMFRRNRTRLMRVLDEPDRTRDGTRFRLFCNAEQGAELERCRDSSAAGVGLMRTEFILARRELADEQAQYGIYRDAVERLGGKVLTIRTLDAGGDKLPEELAHMRGPNPALGLRGIRLSLAMQEMFQVQIRAILRASVHGPVRILLPMLSRVDEVRRTRELIARCREQLAAEGVRADPELEIGGMIETPAAALLADALAAELDFLSIGSNDLIQYLLAVDRQDELVSHLFDPSSRAVIETLGRIVDAARSAARPVQLCGELASDPAYAAVLIGLGLTEFSVPAGQLATVKAALIRLDAAACRARLRHFLDDRSVLGADLMEQLGKL